MLLTFFAIAFRAAMIILTKILDIVRHILLSVMRCERSNGICCTVSYGSAAKHVRRRFGRNEREATCDPKVDLWHNFSCRILCVT
jgi:hypothetical protein